MGDYRLGASLLTEAVELGNQTGEQEYGRLEWLAESLMELGDLSRAQPLLQAGLDGSRAQRYPYGIAVGMSGLAVLAMKQGKVSPAGGLSRGSLRVLVEDHHAEQLDSLDVCAHVSAAQGAIITSIRLWGACDASALAYKISALSGQPSHL